MASQAHPDKEKITYGEWKRIRNYIRKIAQEEGLSEPEMLRKITLGYANRHRKRKGQKPLVENYRSSNNGGRP